jgi:beta-galactosidase
MRKINFYIFLIICLQTQINLAAQVRSVVDFNNDWNFFLGDDEAAKEPGYNDSRWRKLSLPHDWSIESDFKKEFPATNQGGALPGGTGWYRKTFVLPVSAKNKDVTIEFDGVYRNSEVWINGHYLGKRPNGYIFFEYDLTPYIKQAPATNLIAVKVDNSQQPNSRWYTGSGIYRNVKLVLKSKIAFDRYGTYITSGVYSVDKETPVKYDKTKTSFGWVNIEVRLQTKIAMPGKLRVTHTIYDAAGKELVSFATPPRINIDTMYGTTVHTDGRMPIFKPVLWSIDRPYLYKVVSTVFQNDVPVDELITNIGIRLIRFDSEKGFFLNEEPLKIQGVCMHHDLGALGAAFNIAAARRQLKILKEMGCNAIRTAHNPPAPEFLDLCDQMGFLVMDEAFDMWQKRKNKFDYHLDFPEWHTRDIQDMVMRDRNHPSVFIWSIGNEIREQFDSTGIAITKELVAAVKKLDNTRPVISALTENFPEKNFIYQSGALDVLGFNYKLNDYKDLPARFPGQKFIATETVSALATRAVYGLPSDSIRVWPPDSKQPFTNGNADMTVSAYDNTYAYWGATHERSLLAVNTYDFIAGCFVWCGFDFLGEPVPYPWPARSSYYGIIDLAGFPKDVYYMYQSQWTKKTVLHIFPHWNWSPGQTVDVWAYYSNADEVELYLDGKSLGKRTKSDNEYHVMWRVSFRPGTLKAVSRKNGKTVLTREIKTAGLPVKIQLTADRSTIKSDGKDLSFITVRVLDKNGNLVPDSDNFIEFSVAGSGKIVGTDNGYQADTVSLKSNKRKCWKGMSLVIIQSSGKKGNITLKAISPGLQPAVLALKTSD